MRCSTFTVLCCFGVLALSVSRSVCAEDADYLRDIKPLLKSKCYGCHGALKQEGGLRLDTVHLMRSGGDSGPAIDAANVTNSALLQRVMSAEDGERMPPDGEPLTTEQIALVRSWLAAGGHAPANEQPQASPEAHWAFQPVRSVDVPASDGHPIDAFIDQRLTMAGLQRTPRAENVALIRRMFLDLQGLPPDPQQIDLWSEKLNGTEQQRTSALRQLIDELL
ncbi:MAG: DUF1549 domain-containing protein, partial [Planctomycetaceae bacterium]|nr:DUF1549 domain-containing protein [Planctomycetaceae bacterium]